MFTPLLPSGGFSGWTFLKSTQGAQMERMAESSAIKNDIAYMNERLAAPMSLDTFLEDSRLKRVVMTSFGLAGEEWKSGFIRKALTEAADTDSSFLTRLNNRNYTAFATSFAPGAGGMISIEPAKLADIASAFVEQSFEAEVGDRDNDLRLSLNFQSDIPAIATSGTEDRTILFRLLGDVPIREVFETALNLPADFRRLPIERQADELASRIESAFGISDMSKLADPETTEAVLRRFHALRLLDGGGISSTVPGSTALTLLGTASGFGAVASQNLFTSLYS